MGPWWVSNKAEELDPNEYEESIDTDCDNDSINCDNWTNPHHKFFFFLSFENVKVKIMSLTFLKAKPNVIFTFRSL